MSWWTRHPSRHQRAWCSYFMAAQAVINSNITGSASARASSLPAVPVACCSCSSSRSSSKNRNNREAAAPDAEAAAETATATAGVEQENPSNPLKLICCPQHGKPFTLSCFILVHRPGRWTKIKQHRMNLSNLQATYYRSSTGPALANAYWAKSATALSDRWQHSEIVTEV